MKRWYDWPLVALAFALLFGSVGCSLLSQPYRYRDGGGAREAFSARNDAILEQLTTVLEHLESGAPQEARRELNRIAALHPESRDVAFLQRLLSLRKVQRNGLESTHISTFPRNSAQAGIHIEKARTFLSQAKMDEAREELELACALDPENAVATRELVATLKSLGLSLYGNGEIRSAVVCWERVLQLAPNDAETLGFLNRARTIGENY